MTSRKDSVKALDLLPTYLSMAVSQLQLGDRLKAGSNSGPVEIFEERIRSSESEIEQYEEVLYLSKIHIVEHLESQKRRLEEDFKIYSNALHHYLRLSEGNGTEEELWAFGIIFGK